jgi:S-layer homology domain
MHLSTSNRIQRLILVAALGLGTMAGTATPVEAATDKPSLLGFSSGTAWQEEMPDFRRQAGKTPAIYQLFLDVERNWTDGTLVNQLNQLDALGLTPYLEIHTQNLAGLNAGSLNGKLDQMGSTLAGWLRQRSGRHLLIASLPEMNISDHPWSGNPSAYKAGYRRIRQSFLGEGLNPSQIRFVFAANGVSNTRDGAGNLLFYEDYYPGDEIVDIIGFAKLNNGEPWRDYEVTFQRHIDQMREQISLAKPILITQTGSVVTGLNGESRDTWLREMFSGLEAHEQVIGAIYFNRNKSFDWRVLVNGHLDPVFSQGYQTWSPPSAVSWIFDGRMDAWVRDREARFGTGFLDTRGHIFEPSIDWLASEGITLGCNPPLNTRFCPDNAVTRGQMAVFISRALNLPDPSGDHFDDDRGHFYESAANQLYEAGITQGCSPNQYCGETAITREQMAAFLARTRGLPAAPRDFFIDDESSIFEPSINRVAAARITLGCNPPTNDHYCPTELVTRGQMAAFLRRAFAS